MQPSDAEIQESLQEILRSEEFAPRASERLFPWLEDGLQGLLDALGSLGRLGTFLAAAVLSIALFALVRLIRDLVSSHAGERLLSPNARSGDADAATPESLLARAHALADAGALRDAARALQAAALRAVCAHRNLPWRPALTDGEWLELLGRSPEVIELTRATQQLAFGPQPTRSSYDACEDIAARLVAESEAP